jgi:hypothetical protein
MACEHKCYKWACEDCLTHGTSRRVGVPRLSDAESEVIEAAEVWNVSEGTANCMPGRNRLFAAVAALRAERAPKPRYTVEVGTIRDNALSITLSAANVAELLNNAAEAGK